LEKQVGKCFAYTVLNHTPQEKHQQETYSMTLFMNTELVIPTEAGLHSCPKKTSFACKKTDGTLAGHVFASA